MNQKSKRGSERKKFTTVSIPTSLFKTVEERMRAHNHRLKHACVQSNRNENTMKSATMRFGL